MISLLDIFGIFLLLTIYFLPTLIAWGKSFVLQVFFLNLLLGWTFIGWVIAFVWACGKDRAPEKIYINNVTSAENSKSKPDDMYTALEKLSNLHKNGILTDEEFAEQKRKLLNK